MPDWQPHCDFQMTVRVEIPHQPGQFAQLATALAEENANLGAIDIVEVKRNRIVRDVTFDAESEAHALRSQSGLSPSLDLRARAGAESSHARRASHAKGVAHGGGKALPALTTVCTAMSSKARCKTPSR